MKKRTFLLGRRRAEKCKGGTWYVLSLQRDNCSNSCVSVRKVEHCTVKLAASLCLVESHDGEDLLFVRSLSLFRFFANFVTVLTSPLHTFPRKRESLGLEALLTAHCVSEQKIGAAASVVTWRKKIDIDTRWLFPPEESTSIDGTNYPI